jgi:YD repeat-containing protein
MVLLSPDSRGQELQYQYDHAGDRTSITWPDAPPNALTAQYDYHVLGRVTEIDANPPSSGATILAKYTYDAFGNRTRIGRADGASVITNVGYDAADRLKTLTQNFAATANDVQTTQSYSYNASPQVN